MQNIEQKIKQIEERNKRVEVDKAWETSWARRLLLTLMTFFKKLWIGKRDVEDFVSPKADCVQPTEDAPPQGPERGLIEEKEDFKRKNLAKLRDYIKDKERVSNDEVEKMLNVSNATATRYLDKMEKEGLLEQVGHIGQGVYYKVK